MSSKRSIDNLVGDLKCSAKCVGRLYPVLEDFYGNIIDGQHRLEADGKWPRMRIENIKTEKQRIIAKLISNTCRRFVTAQEKTDLLGKLAEIQIKEGMQIGELSKKIAEELGMSYTWVMKYLPEKYKDETQSAKAMSLARLKATSATRYVAKFCGNPAVMARLGFVPSKKLIHRIPPNQKFIEPKYSSTNYAIYCVIRTLDEKIVHVSKMFMMDPSVLVQKILENGIKEMESLAKSEIDPLTEMASIQASIDVSSP